jgi:hypothetical protein
VQALAERQETAERTLLADLLRLGTMDQAVPFHVSTRVFGTPLRAA